MKRALLVAFNFPPGGGVGMFRVAKFAKYMPEFGWDPQVITVPRDSPGVPNGDQFEEIAASVDELDRVRRILPGVDANVDGLRWIPRMLPRAISIVRERDVDVVLFTCGPFVPTVAGPIIETITGVPYVIDLRDSWTETTYTRHLAVPDSVYYWISRRIEPRVLARAASIVVATETMRRYYEDEYESVRGNVTTITNGFDPPDYEPRHDETDAGYDDDFTIVYTGTFDEFRNPVPFLRAFAELIADGVDARFVHVGHEHEGVVEEVRKLGLEDSVDFFGYTDRRTLSGLLAAADAGLVLSSHRIGLTTKVFDYMAFDMPFLAVGPADGALADLAGQFENGFVVRSNTEDEIGRALGRITDERPSKLGAGEDRERYHRRRLTGELARLLDDVAT